MYSCRSSATFIDRDSTTRRARTDHSARVTTTARALCERRSTEKNSSSVV
jgi:hypothetical protein